MQIELLTVKKPLEEICAEKEITVSTSDPDCGLFRKRKHKVEFAYTAHTACDKHNFVLGTVVKAGNVRDSMVFDEVTEKFSEVDAGYKTPWKRRIFQKLRVCIGRVS